MSIQPYKIEITLDKGDFEASMGRVPRSQEEFEQWCNYYEKGLLNGHIDVDILYECTRDAMGPDEDEEESGEELPSDGGKT